MSPEGPRFPFESKSFENDKKDKPSKKKGSNVRIPASLLSLESKAKPLENGEPTAIEKALAELAARRAEKAQKPEAPKPTETTLESVAAETVSEKDLIKKETSPEPDETNEEEDGEIYEKLPTYEPAPVEFSGGEVIIHLNGEKSVAEHVIPLQAETGEGEIEPDPSEEQERIFTPQPPQQHQATGEQGPEPAAAGGETPPPEPPERSAPPAEQPPERPQPIYETVQPRPEDIYQQHFAGSPNTVPLVAGAEKVATKQELEDARYYAARAGQNRGLATGLFVGGLYEHFKHKRREKKAEKRFKVQTKELDEERKQNRFIQQEKEKQTGEHERQYNALEKRLENNLNAEKIRSQAAERPPADPAEQLIVPEDHRLETSAWHTIEVDAKTGKAVENPAFEYGHEYYQERAHENRPAEERDAVAGQAAVAAATMAAGGTQAPTTRFAQNIPSASIQGPPSAVNPVTDPSTESTDKPAAVSSGPLWPWLTALAVIVALLLFLLG